VTVPPEWLESIRHLARVREHVRRDLARARHRVSKLLLVDGRVYPGKTTWSRAHRRWLSAQGFRHEPTELAFCDLLAAVDGLSARRGARRAALAAGPGRAAVADGRPPALVSRRRHADRVGASPRALGRLGALWLPAAARLLARADALAQPVGESESHGPISKTGSGIARRLLVEAAWHYARQPRIGVTLQNRQAGQPDHVLQIAWRAQQRLHRVHRRLRARGKPGNVATVAVARELAGFLWAAATAP
jgi:transposase